MIARPICWSLPLALALTACQTSPPLSSNSEPPAVQSAPATALYQVFAQGDIPVTAVTADSGLDGQPAARAFDSDAGTAWTSGGYRRATSWVTLQLADRRAIGVVRVKTGPLAAGTTYDVQVSDDGETWTTALAAQTNTSWDLEAKPLPAGTAGRQVRLRFHNAAMAHVSVYEVTLHAAGATAAWATGTGTWNYGNGNGNGYGTGYGSGYGYGTGYGGDSGSGQGVGNGVGNGGVPAPRVGTPPVESQSRYWPDLLAIAPSSFYVDLRTAGKRLLRFPTAIGNAGKGHLQVRGRVVGNVTQATQEILNDEGRVVETKDVGTFELHPNHGHFHVSRVARYELRRGKHDGELVQNGKKISFCMEDSIKIRDGAGESRIPDCSPTLQGITRGYADVYSANLPEQTFNLEDLDSGEYTIVIQLDPDRKFLESNRGNNMAWLRFRYDAAAGKVYRMAAYP